MFRSADIARIAASFLLLTLISEPLHAAPNENPVNLIFKVDTIAGRIENMAGAVADLEVKETETEIKIELSGDVLFDFDKSQIRQAAEPILGNVAEILKKYPKSAGRIEGHTDSKGDDTYNMRLSERRADSVKQWLQANGSIDPRKITTRGFGETKPVAPNAAPDGSDDEAGRQKNRRVEIVIQKRA